MVAICWAAFFDASAAPGLFLTNSANSFAFFAASNEFVEIPISKASKDPNVASTARSFCLVERFDFSN